MKRSLILAAVAASLFGACDSASTPEGMGSVRVQLTDAPFPFDSVAKVEIHVVRVDARLADADSATAADVDGDADGWFVLAQPHKIFDLLTLQGGKFTDLGTAEVPAGTYNGLRLVIDPAKSSVTLKDGTQLTGTSSPGVKFPSADRSGLKIDLDSGVEVDEDNVTILLIDFDVGHSFVMRGNSISQNGLLFKPTLKATVK